MAVQLEEYSQGSGVIKLEMGDLPASSLGYILSPGEAYRLETALFFWRRHTERYGHAPERILVDNNNCAHIHRRKEDFNEDLTTGHSDSSNSLSESS